MTKPVSLPAIRLTRTAEVVSALALAKRHYPTLSDPEILKVGLAKLITSMPIDDEKAEVLGTAAYSLRSDGYLDNPEEDIYRLGRGEKVNY